MKTLPSSKLILRTSVLALTLVVAIPVARADQITFTFHPDPAGQVEFANATTFGAGTTGTSPFIFALDQFQDTKGGGQSIIQSGTVTITPISAVEGDTFFRVGTSPNYTSLFATYGGTGATVTVVDLALCAGTTGNPGLCLSGVGNTGQFSASTKPTDKSGAFSGSFSLTYLDPAVAALFDDGTNEAQILALNSNGILDSFASTGNAYNTGTNPLTNVKGTLANGSISQLYLPDSPVPEPGSLALFGTGLLGLAALVRRKYMVSR